MSSEFAPSETTPLRTTGSTTRINLNNNNIRLESGVNGHMQAKMDSRRILCKVALDFFILLCVGFPILFFYLWGEPYKRGFFCDDDSLKHPFHESTVKNWMLYIIGLVLPISIILTTEVILANLKMTNNGTEYKFGDWDVPLWVVNAYKQIGVFGFGAAISQLTTDIAKYSIGRLRPHFISVCQPLMPDGTTCDSSTNYGKYIEEFTCNSEDSSPRMLKEMRLSFPSGHSSFSAFTMVYCALFLQSRMTWRGSKLVKHFLQFLLIMLAWYTALSRVSDYKHHWSDALAGSLLGSLCALVVANYISDLFEGKTDKYLPSTRHDLPQGVRSTNGRV